MKSLPWIAAIAGLAAATYVILNQPGPEYATGNDTIEGAARKASKWGSTNRISGTAGNVFGKVKEGFGRATGDAQLADEGADDQLVGSLKDAAGKVAQAAGQTIHDLNR